MVDGGKGKSGIGGARNKKRRKGCGGREGGRDFPEKWWDPISRPIRKRTGAVGWTYREATFRPLFSLLSSDGCARSMDVRNVTWKRKRTYLYLTGRGRTRFLCPSGSFHWPRFQGWLLVQSEKLSIDFIRTRDTSTRCIVKRDFLLQWKLDYPKIRIIRKDLSAFINRTIRDHRNLLIA